MSGQHLNRINTLMVGGSHGLELLPTTRNTGLWHIKYEPGPIRDYDLNLIQRIL